jgi:hypothetical protein
MNSPHGVRHHTGHHDTARGLRACRTVRSPPRPLPFTPPPKYTAAASNISPANGPSMRSRRDSSTVGDQHPILRVAKSHS